jgi:hypothetical protein
MEINKGTIEDNIFSEKNGNFQTMNMIHKLKKIKKKRKPTENIKKMEFPEVLSNIKEESELKTNEKVTEGFERFKFEHDDWDGYDNVKDSIGNVSGKDPRQVIIDFINFIYSSIVSYNHYLATSITEKLSQIPKKKESDKKKNKVPVHLDKDDGTHTVYRSVDEVLMYKYICLFEAIIFSSFVVNNWYYLMFYNNYKDGEKVQLFDFSVDRIKSLSDDYLSNKFVKYILLYFIEYALFFPEKLQYYLINMVPGFASRFLNHTLCYIILFLITLYISYNSASGFKNFLIDVINVNYKNFLVCIMYITVIIVFLIPDVKTSVSGGAEGTNSFSTSTSVFKIIWNIVRFLIIISISLPLGGLFCFIYFVFYSLFAMLYYSNWDPWKVAEVFKEVLRFVDNKKIDITGKEDPSLFETILLKINQYMEYISDNLFILVFLLAFIYSLTDSLNKVKNNTLRSTLYFIDISFIFIIIIFLIYLIKAKFNISSFTEAVDVLKNINNKTPIEKNYDTSTDIFFFVNLATYGLTLGTLGYLLLTFIRNSNGK